MKWCEMLIAAFFIITKSGNPNTVQSGERIEKCGIPTKKKYYPARKGNDRMRDEAEWGNICLICETLGSITSYPTKTHIQDG